MQMASLKTDKQVVAVTRELKNCGWRKKAKKLSVKFSTSCSFACNEYFWVAANDQQRKGGFLSYIIHWKDLKIASQLEVDYSP